MQPSAILGYADYGSFLGLGASLGALSFLHIFIYI